MSEYYQMEEQEVRSALHSQGGLTSQEAAARQEKYGWNERSADFSGAVCGFLSDYSDHLRSGVRYTGRLGERRCYSGGDHHERNFGDSADGEGRAFLK